MPLEKYAYSYYHPVFSCGVFRQFTHLTNRLKFVYHPARCKPGNLLPMKNKITFALFWYLFSCSLYGINAIANAHSSSWDNAASSDRPGVNFPLSIGAEIEKEPLSVSDDFVIRRKADFNNHSEGYYTDAQYKSDWKVGKLYLPNTTQVRTVDGKKVLASFFPKGTWGRGGGLNQWSDFRDTPDDITEIYWTFRIKYQNDFDWALGAKLPGVGFGFVQTVASGGAGPGIGDKGASLRLMQVAGGKLKLYVYHHSMGNTYGDDMGQGTFGQLKRGEWQELTVRVVANQIGKANGIMQVWLDGVLVASAQNIEMRTATSPQRINSLALHTFMGGNSELFAPDRDQFMWMDDVHFWQYSKEYLAANSNVARGLQLHPASQKLYTPISGVANSNTSPTVGITSPSSGEQFKVGETVSIAAAAADSDGTVAKVEFYNGTSLLGTYSSAPYSYSWSNVSAGEYSITAKATDNKGAVTTSESVKITVMANVSPTVGITSPSSGEQFKVGETVSIAAAAADSDGTVAKVEFYNGTSLLGTDTSAPYSYSWSNVSAGEYSITAKATDNKGAVTSSEAVKITVMANASPTISLTSPSLGGQFKVGETVSIAAAAADSDGTVAKVEFYNGTSLLGTDTSAPYSYSWTNVSAGEYSITAKATDNKGAVTTSEAVKITVLANASPTISLTSPSTGAQFKVGEAVSIAAAAADSDGTVAKVEFYNGTSLLGTDTSAPYSYSWSNVSAGEYSITAKVTDNKGAVTSSEAVKITVMANANPTISLTSPSTGTQFKVGETVSITAAAADSDGTVAKVEFYNGTSLLGTDTSAPYSYSWTNVSAGEYSITAKATDNKGAVTTSEAVKITVMANASPTISLTSPSTGAQFKVGKTVSITAAAADSDGAVAKVEFYNGTSLLGTDISVPYSYSWTNVSAGEYSITAKATDNKGAVTTSEAVKIAVLANAKPTVRLTSPSSGGQFKVGEAVSITAAAADSDGTVAKVEFYNGTSLLGTDTSAPYSYSCKNLSTGIHSITAKATDNYGAIGTSELVKVEVAEARDTSSNQEMTGGLADGLVSFYEMDTNVSGVLVDSHGNNHGTNSSIDQIKRGNGHSNRYNGKSSVSNVPHKSSLNLKTEFTLMADVYRLAQGQEHGSMIVGKTYSSSQPDTEAYSISITKDNKIRIRANIGYKKEWVSSKTVPEGKWVRVIATYKSGEGFSLYLDTTSPEKSGKFSGTLYQSSQGLTIGASRAAYRRRLEGRLDNVAIWNRKLSTTEIEKLITSKAASYAGLIGNQTYTVTMRTVTNQLSDDVAARTSIEAEAGEKLVFFVEGEQEGEIIFDYWSVDGVKVSEQSLFEMNMPERDITLTQHFKSFEAPEIRIFLPEGKTEVEALSTVHIGLEIEVNDAQIEKVELYNGETLVGELVDKFSGFDWKDIPEGTHELAAKITDSSGKTYFSNPVVLKSVRDSANDMKQVLLDYVIGPNPAVEHLNIMFTNLDRTYDFEINVVSMSGLIQKTANVRPDGSKVTIDVSDLKNGVYILQLKANGNAVTSKKFIKQ